MAPPQQIDVDISGIEAEKLMDHQMTTPRFLQDFSVARLARLGSTDNVRSLPRTWRLDLLVGSRHRSRHGPP
ncbi:hypothetical protein [Roseateles asaccharophilus]|uniref:Uncharacterized protein n=1 Tax=Roseateles asaccharophilus TaxID=582607 RepID=A0ABU2A6Y4_9BURK|nr:hypothetical protein [Roseateles asaccharophilus]MDR7332962.1 hypothetical protein [Roseateles asaccharophilus]